MKHKSVTSRRWSDLTKEEKDQLYNDPFKYLRSVRRSDLTDIEKIKHDEILKQVHEYREGHYILDSLVIDPFKISWFLYNQYQPRTPEFKAKNARFCEMFKVCSDCEHIWFISAYRDRAWKFIPTDETRAALSRSLEEFLEYPIEKDLKFFQRSR
jgi:hypothetical protein